VINGGECLTGWREEMVHGQRAWILDLPEVAAGRWYFRSLFVNGKRRPRARLPKFSPDAKGVKNVFRIAEPRFPEKRKLFDGDHVGFRSVDWSICGPRKVCSAKVSPRQALPRKP